MENDLNDICLTCGKEVQTQQWGGICEEGHVVVHQVHCFGCDRPIGLMVDNDHCGLDHLYCPDCVDGLRIINNA